MEGNQYEIRFVQIIQANGQSKTNVIIAIIQFYSMRLLDKKITFNQMCIAIQRLFVFSLFQIDLSQG